jgi:hypothetical protein
MQEASWQTATMGLATSNMPALLQAADHAQSTVSSKRSKSGRICCAHFGWWVLGSRPSSHYGQDVAAKQHLNDANAPIIKTSTELQT